MTSKSTERIHSMDALRGIAMLLGVVTHATLAYTTIPVNGMELPSDFYDHHKIFDFLYLYLHLFRMPLFFLVAGFFARFLYLRIGEKAFIEHRIKRIVVPFLVCLITIRPLTEAPFLFYKYINYQHLTSASAFSLAIRNCFTWMGTFHLWFLYYLSIYYAAMLLYLYIGRTKTGQSISRSLIAPLKQYSLFRSAHIFLIVLPVFCLLMPFSTAEVGIDTGSIFPKLSYLLFYGFFFFLGILVNFQIKDLQKAGSNTWMGLGGGTLAAVMFFILRDYEPFLLFNTAGLFYLCKLLTAISAVLLTFGFLGLFMRYFSFESRKLRYISDSSYWVYLIHLCFVLTFQAILAASPLFTGVKFLIVLIVPTLISFVTYECFVRYTIIGKWLHGSRKRAATSRHESGIFLTGTLRKNDNPNQGKLEKPSIVINDN